MGSLIWMNEAQAMYICIVFTKQKRRCFCDVFCSKWHISSSNSLGQKGKLDNIGKTIVRITSQIDMRNVW